MRKRSIVALGIAGVLVLGLAGFGGWLTTLPSGDVAAAAEPVPEAETAALLAALQPLKRERPVIAIIGLNDATETNDYLLSTGILRRADIADVQLVATDEGPVKLFPALTVEPDTTVAAFDQAYPDGADFVIVPAMSRDDDPAVMAWLKRQAEKGSVIIGVCAGAKVVAAAGLLDGKRGTTHWFYIKEMLQKHPSIEYVADRRFVADGKVVTTTGITASIPLALTLIEAIAGASKAEAVAAEIGITHWDAAHNSDAFKFTRPFATTVMGNVLQFWSRDTYNIPLAPEFDAVSLAIVVDAWSRTYRSKALTSAASEAPVAGANGIRIVPDMVGTTSGEALAAPGMTPPAAALDHALGEIAVRYGEPTAHVVAMQLEYPQKS
jgi:putative intracellular protease/amidase